MFLFQSSRRPSWESYLVTGTAALLASWALAGCRFGNHVENPPAAPRQFAFYDTEPKTLTYTATLATDHQVSAPLSMIPPEIAAAMSEPVALLWTKPGNEGDAMLTDWTGQGTSAIPVSASSKSGTLSFMGESAPATLWTDDTCTDTLYLDEAGTLTNYTAPTTSSVGGGLPVTGKLKLSLTMTRLFDGPCGTSLQAMRACYLDGTTCGGATLQANTDLQNYVRNLFQRYIDAGAMTASDIPDARALTFTVTYD